VVPISSSAPGEGKLLQELRVKNFGIVEEIHWILGSGLNIVTGETGAGKSLVVDAVEAVLTASADTESIRYGASEAYLEATFALPSSENTSPLIALLDEKGLDAGEGFLTLSYELRREGRSTVRVNRQAVPRALLQQIGGHLVDIHGQSEHLSLLNKDFHLTFLDSFAHTRHLRHNFSARATELSQTEHELKALVEQERELARRQEYLRFQVEEIGQAQLHEGEEEDLTRERDILSSCEKLKSAAYEAYRAIHGDDTALTSASVLDRLSEAATALRQLAELDAALKPSLEFITDSLHGLEEVARDIHSYADRLEYDPQRLAEIEIRLGLLGDLKRKYGHSIAEVLHYQHTSEAELDGLTHSAERRTQLEAQCHSLKEEMGRIADELSRIRSQASEELIARVDKELKDLNMPQVTFAVSIKQLEAPDGIPFPDGKWYAFSKEGADTVEFMAATNPGEPLKPLAKIASTGEISRFMLALKGALSEADDIPVLIFDEIDIGVGGRSGEVLGKKLWDLARARQVICITHLPQIAALADVHYSVSKETTGSRVSSVIEPLNGESRLKELAVMLAGPHYTETSLTSARELLQKAATWKQANDNQN